MNFLGIKEKEIEKFLSHIAPDPNSGCWHWDACCGGSYDHPIIRINGKNMYAHRLSFELFNRKLIDGEMACHRCDVPCCVNPKHLFAGNNIQNRMDAVNKRRHAFGERNYKAKLTESQVLEIRGIRGPHREIAKLFNISASTVSYIMARKTWKHLSEPPSHG